MELIVFILKIILIVLLGVLGLILFLSVLILFVPIHYEVKGSFGDSWEVQVKGKVTYLLSAFQLLFFYEKEQFETKVFLFGFQKKMREEEIFETSEDNSSKLDQEQEEIYNKERKLEKQEIFKEEKSSAEEESGDSESVSEVILEKTDVPETERWKRAERKSEKRKKRKVRKKKTNQKKNKPGFSFIKRQLTDEKNKSVVKKICLEFIYLLRHFKFRKMITDLHFSAGDPALTGQVLGMLCMIPMLYRYDLKMVPDFEEESIYIKGTFFLSGRVRLIHILITFLRLIFDKEVRIVGKKISSLLEN